MYTRQHNNWMERGPYISELHNGDFRWCVSTERYHSKDYQSRERERLWMRVWQIAGRADAIPESGDWMEYRLFDQSWIIVRGRDGTIRGFVNACRHRGNLLCKGKGHSSRFLCPYHNWSFGLEGQLLAVARPDFGGSVEEFVGREEELGLIQVPVECFAGFVYMNPDPNAAPLAEFLGEAAGALGAYPLESMIPVGINVRERVECNWKVIMDAFGEGYHTQGVHRELVGVVDLQKERFHRFNDHGASTTPFGEPGFEDFDPERAIDVIMNIPTSHFPGLVDVLPRFAESVGALRDLNGALQLPANSTPRNLLQRAVRATLTDYGVDVSELSDCQMIDYQFWLFFPNVFLQICAGEATVIICEPDPEGNPNRCFWRVMTLRCLRPEQREESRAELMNIAEGDHFPYFLALEQDYRQMAIQQEGLRNRTLKELALTRQEPRVAHFHAALDRWMS